MQGRLGNLMLRENGAKSISVLDQIFLHGLADGFLHGQFMGNRFGGDVQRGIGRIGCVDVQGLSGRDFGPIRFHEKHDQNSAKDKGEQHCEYRGPGTSFFAKIIFVSHQVLLAAGYIGSIDAGRLNGIL